MMAKYRNMFIRLIIFISLSLISGYTVYGQTSDSYDDIRVLLSALDPIHHPTEQLATLFHIGDEKIIALINALDDPDRGVRYNAQSIIRYLGNDKGMGALTERCKIKVNICLGLPIPVPLRDFDYQLIRLHFVDEPPLGTPLMDSYLFALALDGSTRATLVFHQVIENSKKHEIEADESRYIQLSRVGKISAKEVNLTDEVLKNASFLSARARQLATAKLISYNGAKDKALLEIYVNGGPLAEEWYHIVLSKYDQEWKFFSVTLVALS